MERFRAHGFSNTSLDDLAEATGVNRPSLYATFGDKKALYLAGLARTHANVDATFAQLHAAQFPPEKMLKALFLGALEGFLTGEDGPAGCIAVNTAATEAVTDPDIRAALAGFVALQDDWIERLMAEAGSGDPRGDAQIASSVIHSLSTRARAGTPRDGLIAIARKATVLLLADLPG
ncbi:TetR/AcrR family transcriptional regulator [Sphingomonas sp. KR3-1]|uniref:TetR/AcrR family transcriptional regulator n=1 Tax=Sphingomonas sp. KR3-1 TaxID=3156611 RepID=UPI0032B522D2